MMSVTTERTKGINSGLREVDADDAILVVEDDGATAKLIVHCLTAQGYSTVSVSSGEMALAWLKQNSPRLVLLDYSLPDMRGEKLLQEMKARGRRVPFVVASGHGSERLAVEMMKQGAYDYLVKGPMFLKMLPAVVEHALEMAQQSERLIQAEERLREAHEDLEMRVARRTAELADANHRLRIEMEERRRAEEQVLQHQAELAHVARLSTVGEMVAELAHELNQPLSAISSYAQACRRLLTMNEEVTSTEDMLNSLSRVAEQADRAAEIIRRLRRFVTKGHPQQESIDLNELIRNVVELMSNDAKKAECEVSLHLGALQPQIVGDRLQIEQVMVNLIRNAFEAAHRCGSSDGQLIIRTTTNELGCVVVEVKDNGDGIPSELLDRVFERFFSTKPNGMGLGLSISQSIIEHHGGKLWGTRNVDRGSTFHFTLPIGFEDT